MTMVRFIRGGIREFLTQRGAGLALSLETLLAILLGIYAIDARSIWLDEAFSIENAADLAAMVQTEGNSWLYYALLRLWFVFGQGEFATRSLSVLFAAATVPVAYLLGKDLFNRRVGILVGLFVAVHPLVVEYAQETRGYTLLVFLTTLLSLVFLRAVRGPGFGRWVLYGFLAALAWYTHFFAGLIVVAHMISLFILRRDHFPWSGVLAAGGVGGALLVPWVAFRPTSARGLHWLPSTTLHDLVSLSQSFAAGSRILLVLLACIILVALIALARSAPRRLTEGRSVLTVFVWLVVPVAVALFFSFLVQPVFLGRYLIVSLVPFLLLLAYAVASLRPLPVSWVSATLVVMFCISRVVSLYGQNGWREEWREATAYVIRQAGPDDVVVFYAYVVRSPFEYYFARMRGSETGAALIDIASGPTGKITGRTSDLPDPNLPLLDSLAAPPGRVWLVLAHNEISRLGRDRESAIIESRIATVLPHRTEKMFNQVRVVCFER